jgi:2-polyprenyl-6-hydroxyphenyl methylase/3-demethylubiquinone-9 3-methyltransferase
MRGYYAKGLAGERLRRCYEIAPPAIQRYLEAEIRFILERLSSLDSALELGCGYGRVSARLAKVARRVVGIDVAEKSLDLARRLYGTESRLSFLDMDALKLTFEAGEFDVVVCLQNGICSFGVDQIALLQEATRVLRPEGVAFFSTYSDKIWPERLHWFELQAQEGLVGEIDYSETTGGTIVCKDGFRSGSVTEGGFQALCAQIGMRCTVSEIDDSSLICEITS